jgi:hypothetical protein
MTFGAGQHCFSAIATLFFYYGSDLATLLIFIEFAYMDSRARGSALTPFEVNVGLTHDAPPYFLLSMRQSFIF